MGNTENKCTSFKIRQVPHCADIAMVILMIMTFGVTLSLKGMGRTDKTDAIIGTAICILFFIGVICCCVCKTKVTFGEGSIIRCRWLFLSWKIDIQDYYAVTYTLGSKRSRGGGMIYIFYLMLYRGNETAYKVTDLRDRLAPPIAEQCIRRNYDYVQLMKLYRYIEEHYPAKAKGYE